MQIYTIGHSNHPTDQFLQLLQEKGIKLIVDIRSAPYSKYCPQFNKEMIEHYLKRIKINYFYAGKQLGGRPQDANCYKKRVLPADNIDFLHEVDYPEVMKKPWFLQGISRLLELAEASPTTIMCSEEDPATCHRHHLIAKYLIVEYPEISVLHIRGDGNIINAKTILTSINEEKAEQLSFV
jgi:uncharacterized protein (DUF488 family)